MDAQTLALQGPAGKLIRRRFLAATEAWQKLFWARLGAHHLGEGQPLETSVAAADEDLLALSTLLHAL